MKPLLCFSFLFLTLINSHKYNFPNELMLKLKIENLATKKFHIYKKSTIDDEHIPIITTNEKEWIPKKKKFVGNYKDRKGSFSASIEVSEEHGKWIKKYFGSFMFQDKEYSLKPADQNLNEGAIKNYYVDIDDTSEKIKKRTKRRSKRRRKRVEIEVLVVLDYTIYKYWYDLKKHDLDETIYALLTYYSQIIAEVDNKFKSITSGRYTYSVKMAGLYVTQTLEDSITELNPVRSQDRIDFRFTLDEIPQWISSKKGKVPTYDVLTVLTKYKSVNGYSGYGLIGSTCLSSSNSISTDKGIRDTSNLVAHEISHNMGAEHDGDQNHCSPEKQYLMTPIHLPNQENKLYSFSPCTIKYFEKHVKKHQNSCLFKKGNEEKTIHGSINKVDTIDKQCQHTKGPNSYFCTVRYNEQVCGITQKRNKEADELMCSEIHCYDKVLGGCVDVGYGAFDRTPCGKNKWCIKNQCVDVALTTEDCPYGDEYSNCESLKSSCGDKDVLKHCCVTSGCLYGDSIGSCASSPQLCWDFDWRLQCCRTCAELKQNNPDCPYGDYFSDCKTAGRDCSDAYIRKKCCHYCASS